MYEKKLLGRRINVSGRRLSSSIPEHTDFLKIDIAGSEEVVIRGPTENKIFLKFSLGHLEWQRYITAARDVISEIVGLIERNSVECKVEADSMRCPATGAVQDVSILAYRK